MPVTEPDRRTYANIIAAPIKRWARRPLMPVIDEDRALIETLMRPLVRNEIEALALDYIRDGRGDDAEAVQLVAAHREAGRIAGAKAMQEEVNTLLRKAKQLPECYKRGIRQIDPEQIARDGV